MSDVISDTDHDRAHSTVWERCLGIVCGSRVHDTASSGKENDLKEARRRIGVLEHTLKELRQRESFESKPESEVKRMYECKICMNGCIECAHLPCGHAICCRKCSSKVRVCPVCKSPIESSVPLFFM